MGGCSGSSGNNNSPLLIILGVGILLIVVCFVAFLLSKKKKNPQKGNDFSLLIESLGGKDNIISVSGVGSRLTVSLKNNQNFNQDKLLEFGISNVLKMSDKIVLVIENRAEEIANSLKEIL